MTLSPNSKIKKYLRIIHRDLGFLMVGVCLIYGISGILLNHMNGEDQGFKTELKTITIETNLSKDDLFTYWNSRSELPAINKIFPSDNIHYKLMLQGGTGIYIPNSGEVSYEIHKKRPFVYWINKLHYNKVKGWSLVADLFAVSLIFFALSGLFIAGRKNGLAGNGKWYLIAGVLIPVLYILFS